MRKKKLIVVLGMHRSGTSTVTRGLQVLGIDLGQNLMPPIPDNNNKGFYEDIDLNAINIELIQSFKHLKHDWHTLAPISVEELLSEKNESLRVRAIDVLQSRLQNVNRFGFKDPRTCRLLPFWQRIFAELHVDVFYVIALRNPLSVVHSLERLHEIPPEKGFYLWLEHVLASVLLTQETSRVLVDYDLLLKNPEKQLARIAKVLNIDNKLDPTRLSEFKDDFIDMELRHTVFHAEDVYKDPLVPVPVKSIFNVLSDVTVDKLSLDSEKVTTLFEHISEQMEGMAQALNYILHLENLFVNTNNTLSERKQKIEALEESINTQTSQLSEMSDKLSEREQQIKTLEETINTQTSQLSGMSDNLSEQKRLFDILEETDTEKRLAD